jgi:hypothetical protein
MTQYVINIGALPNDGTGDPLRTAFNETNLNFNQVFAAGPVLSNIRIANNTILTTNTNGNLVLAPNGVGVVQANVNIVPNAANIRNLGAADRRWSTAYLQYANISGNIDLAGSFNVGNLTVSGNLTVTGNTIQIGNLITDAKTIQLANTAASANAANGSGMTVGANDNIATLLYNSAGNVWNINIGMSAVGNITAPYFIGNGSQLTGVTASGVAASALTGNTLSSNVLFSSLTSVGTLANLSVSGNIAGGNILTGGLVSAAGNITGNYILGNISQASGFPATYGNANVATFLAAYGSNTISTAGNVTVGNILPAGYVSATGNVRGANFNTDGTVSATGNITGNYFIGNGSQLTGIVSSYGNANVVANLAALGSNPVSTTGNISGGNLLFGTGIVSGTGNITAGNIGITGGSLTWANASIVQTSVSDFSITGDGQVTVRSLDGTYQWTFDSNGNLTAPGNVSASGNVTGNYILGNGSQLTSLPAPTVTQDITSNGAMSIMLYDGNIKYNNYATVEPSSGNITGGNILTGGLISATGNIRCANVNTGILSATGNITGANVNTGIITLTNGAVIKDTTGESVAFGQGAGNTTQGQQAVAIGLQAGFASQGNYAVAIGKFSANSSQGNYAVAVGPNAGFENQSSNAVAIGSTAGASSQGINSVAVGVGAAYNTQGNSAVAVGNSAGYLLQGLNSVAIGDNAGFAFQGANAVAIGRLAGNTNQANNSIIINATGAVLDQPTANTFTVSPVRNDVANVAQVMFYNTTSKEITYGNVISVAGNITGGNILTGGLVSATGNVTGNYILGNGSQLTSINAVTVDITDTNGLTTVYYPTFVENRANAQIARADVDLTYRTDDNLLTVGNVSVTGNVTGGNLLTGGQITSTGAGNTATNGGQIFLNGATLNRIDWNTNGLGAPEYTTRSAGAKVVLYPSIGGSATDYALGVEAGALWSGIPGNDGGQFFKWYGGNVPVASLSGTGVFSATGNVTGGNILTGGLISATGNISGGNLSLSGNITSDIGFTGATITINNSPGGNEGGELKWALPAPANTVLTTSLIQDVFQNGMRFFESGGNTRGLYMDLGNVPNGSGTAVGYRDIPQVSFTGNATLAATDAGRHYYSTLATANTLTIANNTSVSWTVGTAITVVNRGSGNITIAQGSGVNLYLAGNSTAANRTVTTYGMATLLNVAANVWMINGTGVS